MKGTIKIEANDEGLFIETKMRMNRLDMLRVFEGLATAFQLTEVDRTIFGSIIAAGGMKKVFGDDTNMVKIDAGLIDKLRRESE